MKAVLTCPLGEFAGTEVQFEDQAAVGRRSENDLVLNSGLVSGRHALVRYDTGEEGWFVEDLNSTNGTYVAGRRITEPTRLYHLDVIGFGGLEFVFAAASGGGAERQEPERAPEPAGDKTTFEELPPETPDL